MRRACLLIAISLFGSVHAHADTKVLRFSQSTALPPKWQQLPERVATSLAAVIDGFATDDSLITLRCDGSDDCLDDIAAKLGASQLVFGTIRSGGDRDTKLVMITRYVPGRERSERTFTIRLTDDAAPRALALEAQAFLEKPLPREPERVPDAVSEQDLDPRADADADADDASDEDPVRDLSADDEPRPKRISRTTYAIMISGGVGLAVGIGFTLQAWSVRDDVARAPDDTTQDLRRIVQLEQRGQLYTTAGLTFSIAGTAVLGFGVFRAMRERRRVDSGVAVAPAQGGATLVYAGSW